MVSDSSNGFLTGRFMTPMGRLDCYWHRDQRTYDMILYNKDGTTTHYVKQNDRSVVASIAEILGWDSAEVLLLSMFLFEEPEHGHAASSDLVNAFYHCEWSDYAVDLMRAEGVIERRDTLIAKYQQLVADNSMRRAVCV